MFSSILIYKNVDLELTDFGVLSFGSFYLNTNMDVIGPRMQSNHKLYKLSAPSNGLFSFCLQRVLYSFCSGGINSTLFGLIKQLKLEIVLFVY